MLQLIKIVNYVQILNILFVSKTFQSELDLKFTLENFHSLWF
jgi:hypothetical protein